MDFGNCAVVSIDLLYTNTVLRAAIPTQRPLSGRKLAGTCARVAEASGANRPAESTSAIAGEFSVRNTSAGEAAPSCTIWLPSSVSLPLRKVTLMPVSRVKPSAQALVRLVCWALYTTMPSMVGITALVCAAEDNGATSRAIPSVVADVSKEKGDFMNNLGIQSAIERGLSRDALTAILLIQMRITRF